LKQPEQHSESYTWGARGKKKKEKSKKKNGLENSLAASYKIEYTLTV
jgi:hypothetical protein